MRISTKVLFTLVMKDKSLSAKEVAIARLVAKGWSNRQIADRYQILEQSVKNAVSHIYRKLGIENRVQLTLLVTAGKAQRRAFRSSPSTASSPGIRARSRRR